MIKFTIETFTENHEEAVKDAIAILEYSLKASDTEINTDGSLWMVDKNEQFIASLDVEENDQ